MGGRLGALRDDRGRPEEEGEGVETEARRKEERDERKFM